MSSEEQFIQLLSAMRSENNDERKAAEKVYNNTLAQNPNQILHALLQIGRTNGEPSVRLFCLQLLRRVICVPPANSDRRLFVLLEADVQALIKTELLSGVTVDTNAACRRAMADLVADVVGVLQNEKMQPWLEVVPWVLETCKGDCDLISMLRIIKQSIPYFAELPQFEQYIDPLVELVSYAASVADEEVVEKALASTISFIAFMKKTERYISFVDILLKALIDNINKENEITEESVKIFIEIAGAKPSFLKPKLNEITQTMLTLASQESIDDEINRLASEFLVSLAEQKPKMCISNTEFVNNTIRVIIEMLVKLPDVPLEEFPTSFDEDYVEVLSFQAAEEFLDRIAIALGGNVIVPILWENIIVKFLSAPEWQYRFTGLKILAMIAEGSKNYMLSGLGEIHNILIKLLQDEDLRVLFTALITLGQLSTDLGPNLQRTYHSEFVPCFISLFKHPHFKVRLGCIAAWTNFVEKFDRASVEQYLPEILNILFDLISDQQVRSFAVTAVAATANCAKRNFMPYYETFVNPLKGLFNSSTAKDERKLRGYIMECLSAIALAVGKEMFEKDGMEIFNMLSNAQAQIEDDDDPQIDLFRGAWNRFALCLQKDFAPFLDHVMQPLLADAEKDFDVAVVPDEENIQGWEYVYLTDDTKLGINTEAMQEKAKACAFIYHYAEEMEEAFFPYVNKCMEVFIPLIKKTTFETILTVAMKAIPYFLNSVLLHIGTQNQDLSLLYQMFEASFTPVLTVLKQAEDLRTRQAAAESLHKMLSIVGEDVLSQNLVRDLVQLVQQCVQFAAQNRQTLFETVDDDDSSALLLQELETEQLLFEELLEIHGVLIKFHPAHFKQVVEDVKLFEIYAPLLNGEHDGEIQFVLCLFDDFVENFREGSHPYFPVFVPYLINSLDSENPTIVQAATYGLGVVSVHGGEAIAPYLSQILEKLINIIQLPHGRDGNLAEPIDNAISSVGKFIRFLPHVIGENNMQDMVTMWLSWLPCYHDPLESIEVHSALCEMIMQDNPHIFGPNFSNLPKILSIFCNVVYTDFSSEETDEVIINIIEQLTQTPQFQAAFNQLPEEDKKRLSSALQYQ